MVNDFEWAIETPVPLLHVGAKFIINKHSIILDDYCGNPFKADEHIMFEVNSFGIGCISSPLSGDNIGKEVMNFTILENTQEKVGGYKVGYFGEINLETAEKLVKEGYWQPYEEI